MKNILIILALALAMSGCSSISSSTEKVQAFLAESDAILSQVSGYTIEIQESAKAPGGPTLGLSVTPGENGAVTVVYDRSGFWTNGHIKIVRPPDEVEEDLEPKPMRVIVVEPEIEEAEEEAEEPGDTLPEE